MNPPANKRKIFAGVLIAGTLIFVLAIVLCNSVPGKASKMLSSSIASAEAGIEQMYPGYLDEVLDKAEFEAFIGSGIEMSDGADSLAVLSQILKMPGIAPVRKAVESIFGVEVEKVNTMVVKGHKKVQNTKAGRTVGKTSDYKKAIVTLTEKSKPIAFFESLS